MAEKWLLHRGQIQKLYFPLIEKEKVSFIAAAVPLVRNWLNYTVPAQYNLESLKVIQNGGMRLPTELRKRVIKNLVVFPK